MKKKPTGKARSGMKRRRGRVFRSIRTSLSGSDMKRERPGGILETLENLTESQVERIVGKLPLNPVNTVRVTCCDRTLRRKSPKAVAQYKKAISALMSAMFTPNVLDQMKIQQALFGHTALQFNESNGKPKLRVVNVIRDLDEPDFDEAAQRDMDRHLTRRQK